MPLSQFPSGQVTPQRANELVNSLSNITNDMISPSALIEMSKTATATTQGKSAVYVQNITTNTLTNNQAIYRGWGYTGNIGAPATTITITLPNSGFDDANYDVIATYLGEKAGVPATRHDVDNFANGSTAVIDASLPTSATQFRIGLTRGAGGGNFTQVLFSWMAIGTRAA